MGTAVPILCAMDLRRPMLRRPTEVRSAMDPFMEHGDQTGVPGRTEETPMATLGLATLMVTGGQISHAMTAVSVSRSRMDPLRSSLLPAGKCGELHGVLSATPWQRMISTVTEKPTSLAGLEAIIE